MKQFLFGLGAILFGSLILLTLVLKVTKERDEAEAELSRRDRQINMLTRVARDIQLSGLTIHGIERQYQAGAKDNLVVYIQKRSRRVLDLDDAYFIIHNTGDVEMHGIPYTRVGDLNQFDKFREELRKLAKSK